MTCAWERLIPVESMPAGVCISWSGFQHGGVVNWQSCVDVQRSECIEEEREEEEEDGKDNVHAQ